MTLEVEAINPVQLAWLPANLGIVARWEVTCGFCRVRFAGFAWELMGGSRLSRVTCPACGTRNLRPHHPAIRGRNAGSGDR